MKGSCIFYSLRSAVFECYIHDISGFIKGERENQIRIKMVLVFLKVNHGKKERGTKYCYLFWQIFSHFIWLVRWQLKSMRSLQAVVQMTHLKGSSCEWNPLWSRKRDASSKIMWQWTHL